ncbi:MAG: hypothetical protein ACD_19C00426G0122 [uncultured bacterium]|nr:MAG: hypothetical protein ACD_19C00426G0122 [uncultured bacterium]
MVLDLRTKELAVKYVAATGLYKTRLPNTLYGYPFYEQNDLSQSELYFGDWAFYIIGDRQTVSVQTTNEVFSR